MGIKLGVSITPNSQSIANNKTNVTVEVLLTFDSGSWNGNGSQGYLTIDGTKYGFWGTFNTGRATSGTETMFSKTVDITHDSEGKKTLAVSAEYITDTWGTKTASASQVLTDIPRASAIAATDANIGSVSMISVLRKSDVYTHSIAYQFGSLSGYIAADGSVSSSEVKHTGTSVPFKLPDSFYAQIPNAKTGTCTLTVKTYSGSIQIGSAETTTFTVTAAESLCKPTVTGTVTDSNDTTKALTGDAAKLVRYKSTAHCTISASANKSASLSEKKIGGTVVSGTTHDIAEVEENAVEFAATDSRGYTSTARVEFEIVPYVLLTSNPSGRRTDPTSGKATLSLRGNYYNGSFGSQSNSLTLRYRYGPQGGSYGSWKTVSPSISGNTYSADISLTGLDYETTYVAEVEVKDELDEITKTAVIRRGIPIFDWGENDFAFHVLLSMYGNRITNLGTPTEDTDAATKNYVDTVPRKSIQVDTLWENASPTSSFAGQTVSVAYSGYSLLMVTFLRNTTATQKTTMVMLPVVDDYYDVLMFHMSGTTYKTARRIAQITSAGIVFTSGFVEGTSDATNNLVIPLAIYGIK